MPDVLRPLRLGIEDASKPKLRSHGVRVVSLDRIRQEEVPGLSHVQVQARPADQAQHAH